MSDLGKTPYTIYMERAIKYASPYQFDSECRQEIATIISKGISKLKDTPSDKRFYKIDDAKQMRKN